MRFDNVDSDSENRMKILPNEPLPSYIDIVGEEKLTQKTIEQENANNKSKTTKRGDKSTSSKISNAFVNVLNGDFLTQENSTKQLPFVIFLAIIAMIYIANGYYAEHTVRKINAVTKEIKELHSEYITTKSTLMQISTQSSIVDLAATSAQGLQESKEAPKKIVVAPIKSVAEKD
jgi:Bacteriodetes cell division protein (FtsL-like)